MNKLPHLVDIGNRLRELRVSRRFTQRELAQVAGISKGHYSNVESGLAGINDAPLMLICRELSANLEWIKTGKGPRDVDEAEKRLEQTTLRESRPTYNRRALDELRGKVVEISDLLGTVAAAIEEMKRDNETGEQLQERPDRASDRS